MGIRRGALIRRTALAATAALALLGGCSSGGSGVTGGASTGGKSFGNDSQTAKGKAYVDAMMADFTSGDQSLTSEQARCMAGKMIDVVGIAALEKAGVTPTDITGNTLVFGSFKPTAQQADAMVDGILGCVDFGKILADQVVGASGNTIPSGKVDCVSSSLRKNTLFRSYLQQTLMGVETQTTVPSDGLIPVMLDVFQKCGVDPTAFGS